MWAATPSTIYTNNNHDSFYTLLLSYYRLLYNCKKFTMRIKVCKQNTASLTVHHKPYDWKQRYTTHFLLNGFVSLSLPFSHQQIKLRIFLKYIYIYILYQKLCNSEGVYVRKIERINAENKKIPNFYDQFRKQK